MDIRRANPRLTIRCRPQKARNFPSRKDFLVSLSSRVHTEDGADVTNQISRIDVGLYQKFLPHGAKAKDGIYKKQGT